MIVIAKSEEHLALIKLELLKCIRIIRSDSRLDEELLAFLMFLEQFYNQQSAQFLCNQLRRSILNESDTVDDVTHYYCHNSKAKSYYKSKLKSLLTDQTKSKLAIQFDLLKMAVLKL